MGQQLIKNILNNELLGETLLLNNEGYRLVAITGTYKNGTELTYSFDKNYDLQNLRLNIDNDDEIDSISCIYPYSFLYENEIKELFGVKIKNISLDFNDKLYKIAVKTPFKNHEEDSNGK